MNQLGLTTVTAIEVPAELTSQQREALLKFTIKGLEAMAKVLSIAEIPAEMTTFERDTVKNLFNGRTTIPIRRYCRALREKKMLEGDQMPSAMILDTAKVKGATLVAVAKECVVTDKDGMIKVPASRVPVHPSVHEGERVPAGIDLVALTMGASTRWTGTEVSITLPMDTLNRFIFTYLSTSAIKDVLPEIPKPETANKAGMRGRRWTYEIYTQLAKMPALQFFELASEWYQSLYRLPAPGKPLDEVRAAVFATTKITTPTGTKMVYVPKDGFKSLTKLREVRGGFVPVTTLANMYSQYVEFNAIQQGEGSGIGMVATALGSWGLSGATQVTCERVTSFIVAQGSSKVVITGLGYAEIMWIHQSVKKIRPDQIVYELVTSVDASDLLFKTDSVAKSLFIKVGPTQLHSSVTANKINSIKVYDPAVVLPRVWTNVTQFLSADLGAELQVYYGAFLPPEEESQYQYVAMHRIIWNSCGFVMRRGIKVNVSRFVFDEKKGQMERITSEVGKSFTEGVAHCITDPLLWYRQFTLSMNGVMTMWAVPGVNNDYGYFNHMAPYNVSGKYKVRQIYNATEDDYYVAYDEVVSNVSLTVTTTSSAVPLPPVAEETPDPAADLTTTKLPDILDLDSLFS